MIGIFDSGVGGLTVMKEYLKKYPEFDYLYLGDQANNPYGAQSKERVEQLTLAGVDFLVNEGCQLIIVACNTASADALRVAQQKYQGNPVILGVLVPAVEAALKTTRFGSIGLIATKSTVESGAYERELKKYHPLYKPRSKRARDQIKLYSQACPLLVPHIEEGMVEHPATRMILRNYLRPLKNAHVDTLIMGCTHYPLLQKEIERMMGKNCQVISSSLASVEAIESYFERHPDLLKRLSTQGSRRYLTTDSVKRFAELGSQFLSQKIEVSKAKL